MTRVWIAAIAALLAVSSALCQAAEPLLFDVTTLKHKPSDVGTKDGSVPAGTFELGQHHRGAQESSGSRLHERLLAAVTAEPAPQQVVGLAHTSSEEPLARVYSPRILAPGIADTYSLRTFAQFDRWRDLSGDAKAYEVYRYLADTHTGLYHMNVVAEGDELR